MDIFPKVTQSESGEDVSVSPQYGSFGADPIVASSEAFQALKNAYEHLKQNYHSVNEKCTVLKLDVKRLLKENEKLKQSNESQDVADRNKIYLLNTKVEELTLERSKFQTLLQSHKQSVNLPDNQQLSETQCQSKNCQKQIESLEKINRDLTYDNKQQEFKIQTLRKQLQNTDTEEHQRGDMSTSPVSETEESNLSRINDILSRLGRCDPTKCYAELQQIKQEVSRKLRETSIQEDPEMETDGNDDPAENTDMVEFDVEAFLSDYKLLKSEVSNLLSEVKTYRRLNQDGMLYFRKRKIQESDFKMEDNQKMMKRETDLSASWPSTSIKRPPKEELGATAVGEILPSLGESDEDLYGSSSQTQQQGSSGISSQGSDRDMQISEETMPAFKYTSSSYGAAPNVPAMHNIAHFQPGSAPNFPTSGRRQSPIAVFQPQSSPHGSGSPVSAQSQGADFKFRIPVMQETGEDLLPPRNPPKLPEDVHVGGRNSPELFIPATQVEEQKEETAQGDITAVDPEWTYCPICNRQFDRSLFSAEYINHHVNSHFDGSSEYEFVDILN